MATMITDEILDILEEVAKEIGNQPASDDGDGLDALEAAAAIMRVVERKREEPIEPRTLYGKR
jgi:hypothetical protein